MYIIRQRRIDPETSDLQGFEREECEILNGEKGDDGKNEASDPGKLLWIYTMGLAKIADNYKTTYR